MPYFKLIGGGECPEQYDVILEGKRVGYLRLRHGYFRADVFSETNDDDDIKVVYEGSPRGDGSFEDEERHFYLQAAVMAIKLYIETGQILGDSEPLYEIEQELEE